MTAYQASLNSSMRSPRQCFISITRIFSKINKFIILSSLHNYFIRCEIDTKHNLIFHPQILLGIQKPLKLKAPHKGY